MAKIIGETQPVKQADTLSFSPATGWVSTKQYVGPMAEVQALAAQIKGEKTDDDAGTPPTVTLNIAPIAGGLATLDVSYDDDIGTGVEFATWSLESSDYEKSIWTHPTVRALAINCPVEYKWLRLNADEMKKEANYDDLIAVWDCSLAALQTWGISSAVMNNLGSAIPPTDATYGDAYYSAQVGRNFSYKSIWMDTTAGKNYTCTTAPADVGQAGVWAELGSACCGAAQVIITYLRDGVEAFIVSQYVLRKSITMPTSTEDIYALQNVNKRLTPWMMENKEGVPAGLKFALPDYGEWLKKAPSITYERNKMTIEQEYWHAEDWNDYIYIRGSY